MPTSPPDIGMPVMDAGVDAAVGLGGGVGNRLGDGGTGVLLAVLLVEVHVNPHRRTMAARAVARVKFLIQREVVQTSTLMMVSNVCAY